MRRLRKIIMLMTVIMICFAGKVCAKSPIAQYYTQTNKFSVSGEFEEMPQNKNISLLMLKNTAEYDNFDADDILYIDSTTPDSEGKYCFTFDAGRNYTNAKIYVKADNNYFPVIAFKTITDENISAISKAKIVIDENIFTVGSEKALSVSAEDENGDRTYYDSCDFYGYDSSVVRIENNVATGLRQGCTTVYAIVKKNGKEIQTAPMKLAIRNSADYASLIGAMFKRDGKILDSSGDISSANQIVFSFDKDVPDIECIRITDLFAGAVKETEGMYDAESMTYTIFIGDELGYSKFKFEIISKTALGKSEIIEGCTADFGMPDVVAAGEDYPVRFTLNNCRGYAVDYSNLTVSGEKNGILNLSENETAVLTAKFEADGKERTYKKTIRAVGVYDIIINIPKLRTEIGETQAVNADIFGTDGTILNVTPKYSVQNKKFAVDSQGRITALSRGTCKLAVSCGGMSREVMLFAGVDGNGDDLAGTLIDVRDEMECGEKQKISLCNVSILGEKSKIDNVVFTTDNADVLRIEGNIVTGTGYGEAVISAEVDGKQYRRKVSVMPRAFIHASIETKSNVLAQGKYDAVKILVNSNEYLSPCEYELFSKDEKIVEIKDNMIYGAGRGTTQIFAKVLTGGKCLETPPVDITVFVPSGGYMIDDINNTDKIFEVDSRLRLSDDGELLTTGASDAEAYVIYCLQGDINGFTVYDHICNPTYNNEDIYFYLSEDNKEYEAAKNVKRYKSDLVNGWGTDILTCEGISGNYRYLKIVMDNRDGNTQATRLDRVEIRYGTEPEIIGLNIVDDCNENEIYKNVLGRKAIISFDQPINSDTLTDITVSGEKVLSGTYDSELYRYEFVIADKSDEKCVIKINGVSEASGKTNRSYTAEADCMDGTYRAISDAVYDFSDDEGAIRVLIKNNTVLPKTYSVLECRYENGRLVGVSTIKSGKVDSASEKYVYWNHKKRDCKFFVWDSVSSMKPLYRSEE